MIPRDSGGKQKLSTFAAHLYAAKSIWPALGFSVRSFGKRQNEIPSRATLNYGDYWLFVSGPRTLAR